MEPARIKVLVAGPHQSGKSCLIKNYCEGRFVKRYLPTIGIDYGVRNVDVGRDQVRVNFFDASGDATFRAIRMPFYEKSQAVIFVVDATRRESLQELESIIDEAAPFNIPLRYLVVSKIDMAVRLLDDEVSQFCKKHQLKWYKCSSMTGENVEQMFSQVFKDVHSQFIK